jgi:hypothetical protein
MKSVLPLTKFLLVDRIIELKNCCAILELLSILKVAFNSRVVAQFSKLLCNFAVLLAKLYIRV